MKTEQHNGKIQAAVGGGIAAGAGAGLVAAGAIEGAAGIGAGLMLAAEAGSIGALSALPEVILLPVGLQPAAYFPFLAPVVNAGIAAVPGLMAAGEALVAGVGVVATGPVGIALISIAGVGAAVGLSGYFSPELDTL